MRRTPRHPRPAFTLIEILVTVAVIGVLAAITLPAIRGAWVSAKRTASLSNLRGIGQTMELYLQSYQAFPFGVYGPSAPPELEYNFYNAFDIWLIEQNWVVLMHQVAPWMEHYQSWLSPGADPTRFTKLWNDGVISSGDAISSYRYSTSFVADPRLWSDGPDAATARVRAIKPGEVAFPSLKVLMWDAEMPFLTHEAAADDLRPVLMTDGSASNRRDRDAAEPVDNPLSDRPTRVYRDTRDGVDGRDF